MPVSRGYMFTLWLHLYDILKLQNCGDRYRLVDARRQKWQGERGIDSTINELNLNTREISV